MNNITLVLVALGVVQGVTEFLPISSSGHLVIFEQIGFFRETIETIGSNLELFINVCLHLATLCAVIIYLRNDIIRIARGGLAALRERNGESAELRTIGYILCASLPAGIAGILFHDFFERLFSVPETVFPMLILNGIILISTKIIPVKDRKLEEVGVFRSLFIGCFQAIAITPGISRAGSTITGGMLAGLVPEESARFSFLMAIPVIAGAGFLESLKIYQVGAASEIIIPLSIAAVITVFVALLSLKLLFMLVRRIRIDIFGYYTIALGIAGMIWF